MSTLPEVRTQCLIVGGGPAGMMAGYLMARAGVNVIVLEKHADFFRDFRGDTIHPSTLEVMHELGVPIDVLWMHISKREGDPEQLLGFFRHGKLLVLLNRDDYFQAGFVIPKGGIETAKERGLPALHREIVSLAPFLEDRIAELDDWSKIKLLTVQINRLKKWCREGLLCIGDSAHAMSPAGGVGINLALQDAVATANLIAAKLKIGPVSLTDLEQIKQRREWPTRLIQAMQAFIHRNVVTGRESKSTDCLPFLIRLLQWFPALQSLPARFVGIGPRPEHIHSLSTGEDVIN